MGLGDAFKSSNCSTLLWIIPFSFIFIIFAIQSLFLIRKEIPASVGVVDYITSNLKAAPIDDIVIKHSKETCDTGYEPLIVDIWPGTKEGCLFNNTIAINHGDCQGALVQEKAPMNLYYWGNYNFCVKRSTHYRSIPTD